MSGEAEFKDRCYQQDAKALKAAIFRGVLMVGTIWPLGFITTMIFGSPEAAEAMLQSLLWSMTGPLLFALVLGPHLYRLRRVQYQRLFHPPGPHVPRADCRPRCLQGLAPLEKLAVQSAEPPEVELRWLWWLNWQATSQESPFSLRSR